MISISLLLTDEFQEFKLKINVHSDTIVLITLQYRYGTKSQMEKHSSLSYWNAGFFLSLNIDLCCVRVCVYIYVYIVFVFCRRIL